MKNNVRIVYDGKMALLRQCWHIHYYDLRSQAPVIASSFIKPLEKNEFGRSAGRCKNRTFQRLLQHVQILRSSKRAQRPRLLALLLSRWRLLHTSRLSMDV